MYTKKINCKLCQYIHYSTQSIKYALKIENMTLNFNKFQNTYNLYS